MLPAPVLRLLRPELAQRLQRALEADPGVLHEELRALLHRAERRRATPAQTALAAGIVLALQQRASAPTEP